MNGADLVLRRAHARDAARVRRVAQLDSTRPPLGDLLVAEVRGDVLAWIELATCRTAADPFRPTAQLVELLQLRARQLARSDPRGEARPAWGSLARRRHRPLPARTAEQRG